MSDYTLEMFNQDHDKLLPIMQKQQALETLHGNDDRPIPEDTLKKIIDYFINKYGKSRGLDYEIRFLTTTEFINHYPKELTKLGLITKVDIFSVRVQDELLQILLDSFIPPQSNSTIPSSSLLNQEHEFNYQKVIAALKAAETD